MDMRPDPSKFRKLYTDYGPAHLRAAMILDGLGTHLRIEDHPECLSYLVEIRVRLGGTDQTYDLRQYAYSEDYTADVEARLQALLATWVPYFPCDELDAEKAAHAAGRTPPRVSVLSQGKGGNDAHTG